LVVRKGQAGDGKLVFSVSNHALLWSNYGYIDGYWASFHVRPIYGDFEPHVSSQHCKSRLGRVEGMKMAVM
jgi:hypothetical protein